MTLETCYKRLEIAKKHEDPKEIAIWEERIKRKGGKLKIAGEVKDGKKSKR